MAKIPAYVGNQRTLETGGVVQYPQGGGPIGAAMENAGNKLQSVAAHFKAKQEQQDIFDASIIQAEFSAQLNTDEDEAIRNAPIDGKGLTESVYGQLDPVTNEAVKPGSYDERFDATLKRMPPSQQRDFLAKKKAIRIEGARRLATAEHTGRLEYEKFQIGKIQDQLVESIAGIDPNDADTFEKFKQQGLDLIEKSGAQPLDKQIAIENWKSNASKSLFALKLAKDPAFAAKARAALGLAPSEAEPTGGQQFWQERWSKKATRAPHFDIDPEFDARLRTAVSDAEQATGSKASIRSLKRTGPEQADAYRNYLLTGGLAAPPAGMRMPDGRIATGSRHEKGQAADIEEGPVLNWLHKNAGRYGLEFLKGEAFAKDRVHIQLARGDTRKMAGQVASNAGPQTFEAIWPRLIGQESQFKQFDPEGRPLTSPKGATGIAQVMFETGPEAAKLAGLTWDAQRWENDASYNEAIGKAYFAKQWKDFAGDPVKALAAYNAGPGRTRAEIEKHGADWLSHMPAETQKYISVILGGQGGGTTSRGYVSGGQVDPQFVDISFEDRVNLANQADVKMRQDLPEMKARIQQTEDDARTSYLRTGGFSGEEPSREAYAAAWGEEGEQRYQSYQDSKATAITAHSFIAKSESEIKAELAEAEAGIPTGPGAAEAQKNVEIQRAAAVSIMKARERPADYVIQNYPAVANAVKAYNPAQPETAKTMIGLMVEAQRQLGIPADKIEAMPSQAVELAAAAFKDVNPRTEQRLIDQKADALVAMVMITPDPAQQRAIFNQLVKAGVPESVEVAIDAANRDDKGASRRLFAAAMVGTGEKGIAGGPTGEEKTTMNTALNEAMFGDDTVGDAYYSLDMTNPANVAIAQRDYNLMQTEVAMLMAGGQDEAPAIKQALKDLFGDVERVEGTLSTGNAVLGFADKSIDQDQLLDALAGVMPTVKSAVSAQASQSYADFTKAVPNETGETDIVKAGHEARVNAIMTTGSFRRMGTDAWGFFYPKEGMFIPGTDGQALSFSDEALMSYAITPVDKGRAGNVPHPVPPPDSNVGGYLQ